MEKINDILKTFDRIIINAYLLNLYIALNTNLNFNKKQYNFIVNSVIICYTYFRDIQ